MAFPSRNSFYTELASLVDRLTRGDFWQTLSGVLDHICRLDEFAVFHYVWSEPPRRVFDRNSSAERDHLHGKLLSAAYLIGPYYNRIVKAEAPVGFYPIDEIIPDGFKESEYYRIYYQEKHAADEGMFYVPLEQGVSLGLLAERRLPSAAFSADEIDAQRSAAPLISALVRQRWNLAEAARDARSPMGEQMVTALECFGCDLLSDRERQIAQLILRGHSSKSGARELGISPETERVHRKRLYGKLDVSSQSELFWLFIQSVAYFDPQKRNDPLQSLLQKRE